MRRGLALPGVPSGRRHLWRSTAGCSWWARAREGAVALEGHLTFAPGAPARECSRPLAFTPAAASRLRPLRAGTVTSSGLPPQMTAGARAALHAGGSQHPAMEPAFEPNSAPNRLNFTKFLEGRDKKEQRESPPSHSATSGGGTTISPIFRFYGEGGHSFIFRRCLVEKAPTFPERVPPPLDAGSRPGTGVSCLYISLSESAKLVWFFIFPSP